MAPVRTINKPTGPPLNKGEACSTCKARKVKCDGIAPACSSCLRSAKFEGRDPESVCCVYGAGRKSRKSRSKGTAAVAATVQQTSPEPQQDFSFDSAPPIVLPSALPPAPSSMYSTTLPMAPASLPALHSSASPIPMISTSTAMAPLPALPSLPPPTAAYDAYNPFDYSYAPEPSYTSTSPINGSYDQWSTLPDFGASVGASLPLNHSLWAFDNSTSPSTSSSSPQSSHFLDDHAASPDSLHSTWSDFPPSPPHLADDLSSCFLASADKYDDTLTLPLFPLMLPPKVEEPTLAWNWMEPVGFGSVEQQRW